MLVRLRIGRLLQAVARLLDERFDLRFEVDGFRNIGHARWLSRMSMMRATMRRNNFRRVEMRPNFSSAGRCLPAEVRAYRCGRGLSVVVYVVVSGAFLNVADLRQKNLTTTGRKRYQS